MRKPRSRILPTSASAPRELSEAELHARVLELPARRRPLAEEVSIEELEAVLALPWAKTEQRRSTVTVRRAAVAAMSRRGPGEKPAGWRYLSETFWQQSGQKKCKECLRESLINDAPAAAHLRTCSAFPLLPLLVGPRPGPLPSLSPPVVVRTAAALRPVPKPPLPVRYAVYLAFVRRRPCAFCERLGPSEPHHFGPRPKGRKASDLRVLPLCASDPSTGHEGHHDYFHRTGTLPAMTRAATVAWIHASLLDLHDEFFGAWIAAGEPPDTEEQLYIDALNEAGGTP